MSKLMIRMSLVVTAAFLVLGVGCSTTKQTEDLLTQAGFKQVPATTPQQQAHLHKLPAGKVSTIQRAGKQYFVFPDVAHLVLYVGQNAQYQQYVKLRVKMQLAEEQMNASDASADADVWYASQMWPATIE